MKLDWLIESIVEPKTVLYIIYIRLFVEGNLTLIGTKASQVIKILVLVGRVLLSFNHQSEED